MTNQIEKGPTPENQENIKEQEINALFDELIARAKENLKIAEEQWKELPGEGNEWDLEISSQFWDAWSKYNIESLKQKLPSLWKRAVQNYEIFTKENRWETAKDWEMSEDDQFTRLVEEMEEKFRKRLDELEKD